MKEKNCQSDHGVQGLHYPLKWSNGFCGGIGKRSALVEEEKIGPMAKKCCPKFSLFEFTMLLVPIVKLQLIQAFDIIDKSCN